MAKVSITRILFQGKHFTPTVVTLEFKIKEEDDQLELLKKSGKQIFSSQH